MSYVEFNARVLVTLNNTQFRTTTQSSQSNKNFRACSSLRLRWGYLDLKEILWKNTKKERSLQLEFPDASCQLAVEKLALQTSQQGKGCGLCFKSQWRSVP
jgi:hypothetical protein